MMFASAHSFADNALATGMLVAVPNPNPYPNASELEACIEMALNQAKSEGLYGAATTPFLLQSIETNRRVVSRKQCGSCQKQCGNSY